MYTLVPIMGVPEEWQTAHPLRALSNNGKSLALAGLETCKKQHPDDFKKILKVMRLVGQNDRVRNEAHVKQGKKCRKVFEMRGGQFRLFFFYTPDTDEVVVCTNSYWKAKASETEQDQQFEICERLRCDYLKAIGLEL